MKINEQIDKYAPNIKGCKAKKNSPTTKRHR